MKPSEYMETKEFLLNFNSYKKCLETLDKRFIDKEEISTLINKRIEVLETSHHFTLPEEIIKKLEEKDVWNIGDYVKFKRIEELKNLKKEICGK